MRGDTVFAAIAAALAVLYFVGRRLKAEGYTVDASGRVIPPQPVYGGMAPQPGYHWERDANGNAVLAPDYL